MYGIYTATDYNFFAGTVAAINALRHFGYKGEVAIIDVGMEEWQKAYLLGFHAAKILDLSQLRKWLTYTDVKISESPVDRGWAYKAFGVAHYDLYDEFTFIDGDYLPACNIEAEVRPFLAKGLVVSTEDGVNKWDAVHETATGVKPGTYTNINAGFMSFNMHFHRGLIWEWRNLMTRRKPFDLWFGDQGAINVIMDKYGTPKTLFPKELWNQTHMNATMARENVVEDTSEILRIRTSGQRIFGWHGTGHHKLWHCAGIDHYRSEEKDRTQFYEQCQSMVPKEVVNFFRRFLFCDIYNAPLRRDGHLLRI